VHAVPACNGEAGDSLVVRRDSERHVFTVGEVVRPQGAPTFLKLVEPLPQPLCTTNSANWTIEP
jgi:hypothetical protein